MIELVVDSWVQIILEAVSEFDQRVAQIVLPMPEIEMTDGNSRVREVGAWNAFENELLVAPPAVGAFSEVLLEASLRGPVLTELGFTFSADPTQRRIQEESTLTSLSSAAFGPHQVVLALLMPASWITSARYARFRESIQSKFDLRYVITSRGVLEQVHESFEVACLVFTHAVRSKGDVAFFQLPSSAVDGNLVVQDFRRLKNEAHQQTKFGYWADIAKSDTSSLAFDIRNPELKAKTRALENFGVPTPIGELFRVIRPRHWRAPGLGTPNRVEARPRASETQESPHVASNTYGAIREIGARDLFQGGIAAEDGNSRYRVPSDNDTRLRPGDLVLQGILTRRSNPNVVIVSLEHGSLLANHTTIVLRPDPQTSSEQVVATALFLRSDIATRLLVANNSSSMAISLSPQTVSELKVFMPDTETLEALALVNGAGESLRYWLQDTNRVLESLYARTDGLAAKQELLNASRTLRARVDQGRKLDDPYARFRSTYPFPLAIRWRMAEAAFSGPDPQRALDAILDAGEAIIAFAACIALVMAREQELNLRCLKEIRRKVPGGRGLSFGDWANILLEASVSKDARRVPEGAPLTQVQLFARADGVDGARSRLKQMRDSQSHGRRLTGSELDAAVEASFYDLVTILEGAAPLSDLGLLLVDQARVDTLQGSTVIRFREFRGDHPVVRYQETTIPGALFEEGSLYLRDTDYDWHLFRPYVIAEACPQCHNWTMFAFDRLVNGTPDYKSLDHGHTRERPDLLGPLTQLGMLDPIT